MNEKIDVLDRIRGIACLIVLAAHIISSNPNIGIYVSGCGKIGVWCFMLMSGWLSVFPYISGQKKSKEYDFRIVGKYYWKKLKTLYPAYVVTLLLGLCTGFIPNTKIFVKHLLCIESTGHFWYMPVIIKFYIVFPVFIVLYKLVQENKLVYGMVVTGVMIVTGVLFPFTKCTENSNMLRWYMPVFCMGILVAILYYALKGRIKEKNIFDLVCLGFIAIIIICTPLFREIIWGIAPGGWLQNKYLLMSVLWSGILTLLYKCHNRRVGNYTFVLLCDVV